MSFLGYDPRALEDRARLLERAARELRRLDDGARRDLGDPGPVLARAAEICERWRTEMITVARCGAATRPHPLTLLDRLDASSIRALGNWGRERPEAWTRDEFVVTLTRLVQVDRARRLAAVHAAAATRVLAVGVTPPDRDPETTQGLGLVVAQIARGMMSRLSTSQRLELLGDLEPDVAAAVLPAAGLGDRDLASAAGDLLDRWETTRWWVEGRERPHNLADEVIRVLATDPVAAAEVLVARRGRLGTVLFGPNDQAHVTDLARAATDPDHHDPWRAAAVIDSLVDYVASIPQAHRADLAPLRQDLVLAPRFGDGDETRWWQLRATTATALAPWQIHLATGHEAWNTELSDALELLEWLSEDQPSATALAEGIGVSVVMRARDLGEDRAQRADLIQRMAFAIGAVDELVHRSDLGSEPGEDLVAGLVALGIGHATGAIAAAATGLVVPPLAGLVRTYTTGRITEALRPVRGDAAGPDLASAQRRRIAATALMSVVAVDQYQRGWLAPSTNPPPPVDLDAVSTPRGADPLVTWLATVRGRREALDELHLVLDVVVPVEERAAIDRGRGAVAR